MKHKDFCRDEDEIEEDESSTAYADSSVWWNER